MTSSERREKLLLRLPVALLGYPFEAFIGVVSALVGAPLSVGISRSTSLSSTLPHLGEIAWGLSLLIGGLTVLSGLTRKSFSSSVPRGLRLIASASTVYGLAIMFTADSFGSGISAALYVWVAAAIAGFRALFLRTLGEMTVRVVEADDADRRR